MSSKDSIIEEINYKGIYEQEDLTDRQEDLTVQFLETNTFNFHQPNNHIVMSINADATSISLFSLDGKEARIDWSTGQVKYSGELPVDDSARSFFEALQIVSRLKYIN